jgi:ribosomal protein S12 methylthiotransferase
MKIRKHSYYLVSLGCAKNTVDSESMGTLLNRGGYAAVERPNAAELLIVNTCGFIQQAREESLDVLQELADSKKSGQLLIAAGCMPERYRSLLTEKVKGIDGFIGTRNWMDIMDLVEELHSNVSAPRYHLPQSATVGTDEKGVIRAAVQGASSYLKIADGCRHLCAFCSIPLIKGTTVSRPMDTIVSEAVALQNLGIQELILIAQDTTDYGADLGMQDGLSDLLKKMLPQIPSIPWVRLLYAYPGLVSDRLIDTMANSPQMLHYLDIPLQHASPRLLKSMKRPANVNWAHDTIGKMRKAMPNLALRTTFIVGYPGETEEDFQTLLDFVNEIQFDHVGVFPFSFEPGTSSEPLGDPIPPELKEERTARLMQAQEAISLRKNQAWIGRKLDVLVEGQNEGVSVGRSYRDAPEIDGLVIVEDALPIGQIAPVQISGALTHDLMARAIKEQVQAKKSA